MFLYLLNDAESKAFLELAALAMQVNGGKRPARRRHMRRIGPS